MSDDVRPGSRKQPQIIVYCTPWCPDCRTCRRYLDEHRLLYTEVDITKDKSAERRARELAGGKLVTPTIDIDGTIVLDFDRKRLDQVLRGRT